MAADPQNPTLPAMPLSVVDEADAARMIVVAAEPGEAVNAYKSGAMEIVQVVAVSVDVRGDIGPGGTTVRLTVTDASGLLTASVVCGEQVTAGDFTTVTFAAGIPDTSQLGTPATEGVLQASLPDLTLAEGDTLTVATVDAATPVGELRLWVQSAGSTGTSSALPPIPVYGYHTAG